MSERSVVEQAGSVSVRADEPIERVREILASADANGLNVHNLIVASEIAIRGDDVELAIAATRRAVEIEPHNAQLRSRLACFHQRANDHAAAIVELEQAIAAEPSNESLYGLLVHSQSAQGDHDAAIAVLEEQWLRFGSSVQLTRQLVSFLIRAQRPRDALAVVERVNSEVSGTEEMLRLEAQLAHQVGNPDQAIRAAFMAWRARRESVELALFLAHLLCAAGRHATAIPLLVETLGREPGNADIRNLLTSAYSETGDHSAALHVLVPLIKARPNDGRLWQQAAHLAGQIGDRSRAADFLAQAAKLEPQNVPLLLNLAHMLRAAERLDEAVGVLDSAERVAPVNPEVKTLRLTLLQAREQAEVPALQADSSALARPLPRVSPAVRARYRRAQSDPLAALLEGLRTQIRVTAALVTRDLAHRTAHSKLGLASAVIEPVFQIVMLGIVLRMFTHGKPPLGEDIFFFYATGVIPFYLFLHVVGHTINVLSNGQPILQVPIVKRLDLIISTALAELLVGAATTVLIFLGFYLLGMLTYSDNMFQVVLAYGAVWLFGIGLALNLAVLNNLSRMTERVWQTLQRFLYFLSGIFFLAASMPDWVRDYLVWNPLLLCVEWFRSGFFPQYNPPWLDRGYVLIVSAGLITTGLMLERSLRRKHKTV